MEEPLILDRYRPLADLGSGGHGSVTLAFDTKMARRVAIKRLPLPLDRSGRVIERAGLAEARTGALLNHPNIVTVHEWDSDSDEAFIVMEAIDGVSLADLLDAEGAPLDLDEAAAVLDAVASAVSFAHDNGVLHLDLKPSNVLVTREGRVKVADFGVSALTDATGFARGTSGTLGYMPPEQLRGELLDERTDVWALASLLYELLTNAGPFDSETVEGSLFRIETADVPAPSEFEPGLPRPVDDVVLAALAPEPDERYSTVRDFARALRPALGNADVGREILADGVSACLEECDGHDVVEPSIGVWDRMARYSPVARRAAAAAGGAWLGWAGISAFSLGTAPATAAAVLVGLAGALAPALGSALGLGLFALGLGTAVSWWAGAGFAAVAAGFWIARGRAGAGDAMVPVIAPVLGIARGALTLPLVLGFVFPPATAAISAGFGALFLAAAAGMTGGAIPLLGVPLRLLAAPWGSIEIDRVVVLADPGLALIVIAWAAAAWVCSIASRGASRGSAAFGAGAGALVLGMAYAGWAAVSGVSFQPSDIAPDAVIASALVILVIALGAPTRPEEE